jgi:hypothetical protein
MTAEETCSEYANCGLIKLLNRKRETTGSDCEKDPLECGRLNPATPFNIGVEKELTDDEIKASFPILYKDENNKPRRIQKGTHR